MSEGWQRRPDVDEFGPLLEPDASRTLPPMREADNVVVLPGHWCPLDEPGWVSGAGGASSACARTEDTSDLDELDSRRSGRTRTDRPWALRLVGDCVDAQDDSSGWSEPASDELLHRARRDDLVNEASAARGEVWQDDDEAPPRCDDDGAKRLNGRRCGEHKGPSGPSPERSCGLDAPKLVPAGGRLSPTKDRARDGVQAEARPVCHSKSTTPHPKAPAPHHIPDAGKMVPDPRLSALHAENQHLRAQLAAAQDALKLAACQAEAMKGLVGVLRTLSDENRGLTGGEVSINHLPPPVVVGIAEPAMHPHPPTVEPSEADLSLSPIEQDRDAWRKELRRLGRNRDYISRGPTVVGELIDRWGWRLARDADAAQITEWLSEQGGTGQTQNNRLSMIATFFDYCVSTRKSIGTNPAKDIKRADVHKEEGVREFTAHEMRSLIAASTGHWRTACVLFASTALRRSAVFRGVLCGWVNPEKSQLEIPSGFLKNRKAQVIPLNELALHTLAEVCEVSAPSEYIVPVAFDQATWLGLLKRASVAYEDKRGRTCGTHSFRKGVLTTLADLGVHPKVAQDLAGHSDIRLTMRSYTKLGLDKQAEAVKKLSLLNPDGTGVCEIVGENPHGVLALKAEVWEDSVATPMPNLTEELGENARPQGMRQAWDVSQPHTLRAGGRAFPPSSERNPLRDSAPSSTQMTPRGFEPRLSALCGVPHGDEGYGAQSHGSDQELPRVRQDEALCDVQSRAHLPGLRGCLPAHQADSGMHMPLLRSGGHAVSASPVLPHLLGGVPAPESHRESGSAPGVRPAVESHASGATEAVREGGRASGFGIGATDEGAMRGVRQSDDARPSLHGIREGTLPLGPVAVPAASRGGTPSSVPDCLTASPATPDSLPAVAHPLPAGPQAPEAGFTTSDKEQTNGFSDFGSTTHTHPQSAGGQGTHRALESDPAGAMGHDRRANRPDAEVGARQAHPRVGHDVWVQGPDSDGGELATRGLPHPVDHTPHPSSAQEAGGISPGAPAGATPARTGTPRVDGQPGTVATPNATSHAGEGPAAPLTQRMETEYHAHHDPRSPLGSVLQLRAPEAGRSVRDGHGQVADRSDRGSGEGGTGRGRGGLSGHRAPDPDAGCSAGGHAGITGGRLPEPPLNPDGDPITMMTAQERRDTLALIRRLLFPALVVLGTCAAAAAMNKQHHEKPVVLTSPN
jgi:integrase